ncbi:MAG: tetratricopeptide repeat protein [Pyrinomonadaceae bacterium MAG19_C2-C3]|nr:tetratricopeptide repeat protein [Pyrinomonadaceae bacterium MAG19_C2-C3]
MNKRIKREYRFGDFRLDADQRTLMRADGEIVPLRARLFDILLVLIENDGRLVSKDELIQTVWHDAFVEEGNLNRNISALRKTLGETPSDAHYIQTVPKHGYRFAAPVIEIGEVDEVAKASTIDDEPSPTETAAQPLKSSSTSGAAQSATTDLNPRIFEASRLPRRVLVVSGAALLVASLIASAAWWRSSSDTGRPAATSILRSLAVLPFADLDAKQESSDRLGIGMADALITKLGNIKSLTVRPTSAVRRYAAQPLDAVAAGRALGVEAVLEGSVQRVDDRVRVTVRLMNVSDGVTLWAGTFDERVTDIFAMQDSISLRVSDALRLELSGEERQLVARRPTQNAEAYRLFLQARFLMFNSSTSESLERSGEYLERAIELDPNFALAHVALATTYGQSGRGLTMKQAYRRQKELVLRAIDVDETLAPAHSFMGEIAWRSDYDWTGAERHMRRAIELDPNNSASHHSLGLFLASLGRFDEAVAELSRARELNPVTPTHGTILGFVFIYARRYDAAVEEFRLILEGDPDYPSALMGLGVAYGQKGMYAEAIATLERANRLKVRNPGGPPVYLGYVYALAGRHADARRQIEELKGMKNQAGSIAVIYAALGERDKATALLEEALESREWWISTLKVSPLFDNLRDDPRFTDIKRRANFTP